MENSPVLFPEVAAKRPTTLSKEVWGNVISYMPMFGLKLEAYTDEELEDRITALQKKDLTDMEEIYDVLSGVILLTEICFDETDDEEYEETSHQRGFFESWYHQTVETFYRKEVAEWAEGEMHRDPDFFKTIESGACLRNPEFYTENNFRIKKKYFGVAFVGDYIQYSQFSADIVSAEGYRIGYIPFEERFEVVDELRFELMKPISHPKVKESFEVGTVKTHREWLEILKLKTEDLVLPFFRSTTGFENSASEYLAKLINLTLTLEKCEACFQYGDGENSGGILFKRYEQLYNRNIIKFHDSLCEIDRMKFDKYFLNPQTPSSNEL